MLQTAWFVSITEQLDVRSRALLAAMTSTIMAARSLHACARKQALLKLVSVSKGQQSCLGLGLMELTVLHANSSNDRLTALTAFEPDKQNCMTAWS